MKHLLLAVMICVAVCVAGVGSAKAGPMSPQRSHWQTVCFMGKQGHPGGCRAFLVVTGLVAE